MLVDSQRNVGGDKANSLMKIIHVTFTILLSHVHTSSSATKISDHTSHLLSSTFVDSTIIVQLLGNG